MKNFRKLVIGCAVLGMTMVACKESKNSKSDKDSADQQTESTSEDTKVETIRTPTVLNANLATESQLKQLNLSAEMVAKILENRPFLTMNQFDAFLGDKEDKAELYKKIFVPFNLNTTAEKDFKMIPGVGDRMAHEFEEYRPYTSIRQFRREIGKYVDENEVVRYQNYVFVPVELNTASEEDIKALPGVGDRMAHEFEEYRPYTNLAQFSIEIGKYVDDKELARLERFVYLKE